MKELKIRFFLFFFSFLIENQQQEKQKIKHFHASKGIQKILNRFNMLTIYGEFIFFAKLVLIDAFFENLCLFFFGNQLNKYYKRK